VDDPANLEDRAALGARIYAELTGEAGQRLRDDVAAVAPALAEHMVNYGFADVYSRPGLTRAQRQLVIISTLATLGATERQLRAHIGASLNAGLTTDEITETFTQIAVYCGFPRAINAVLIAQEVFRERGLLPEHQDVVADELNAKPARRPRTG